MLIIFSGLPGTGKSTIAAELAKQLRAVYLRIDTIEHAIKKANQAVEAAGYFAAYAVALDNLKLNHIVIADSVNPLTITRDAYRNLAKNNGFAYFEIEIICSNLAIHQDRVQNRVSTIDDFKLPTWEAVLQHEYEPWTTDRLVIDTADSPIEWSVQRIIQSMNIES